jgi:predicted helicase
MAAFSDFLATFEAESGKRGKQFEHFVKWFLKNDPEWASQVDEVWLWNNYPRQWVVIAASILSSRTKSEPLGLSKQNVIPRITR